MENSLGAGYEVKRKSLSNPSGSRGFAVLSQGLEPWAQ